MAEQSTCISGAQPPPAVAEFCQSWVDCAYAEDDAYAPEPCPEEYLEDPYYAFYCELTPYDLCVYNSIESSISDARQHGCVEEFEVLLSCHAQLQCSDLDDEEEYLCAAEGQAFEAACPDVGTYD